MTDVNEKPVRDLGVVNRSLPCNLVKSPFTWLTFRWLKRRREKVGIRCLSWLDSWLSLVDRRTQTETQTRQWSVEQSQSKERGGLNFLHNTTSINSIGRVKNQAWCRQALPWCYPPRNYRAPLYLLSWRILPEFPVVDLPPPLFKLRRLGTLEESAKTAGREEHDRV